MIKHLLGHKSRLIDIACSKTISAKDWIKIHDELDEIMRKYLLKLIEK